MKLLLSLLLSLTLINIISAQVRIYKIEKSTASNGAVITFKNYGSEAVDVSGYFVGSNNKHIPIHSTENNSLYVRGIGPVIPAGMTWTIDYTPWASQGSSSGKFSQSSDISLWKNNGYYSDNMLDFVQYCNTGVSGTITCPNFGEYVRAAIKGIWSGEQVHVWFSGFPMVLVFGGDDTDHGAEYWVNFAATTTGVPTTQAPTSVPTTQAPTSNVPPYINIPPRNSTSVPCADVTSAIYELLFKLITLKRTLRC